MKEGKLQLAIIAALILGVCSISVPVTFPAHSLFQFPHHPEMVAWQPSTNPNAWDETSHPINDLSLQFSTLEPSFVYLMINNRTRMGGLWGVVGTYRTIGGQIPPPPRSATPGSPAGSKHLIAHSYIPYGTRIADFLVQNRTLILTTTYNLNQTMPVLDWYWEQCYCWGVDPNARLVFGLSDGSRIDIKWTMRTVPYVQWIWLKYTEWMTGALRTVLFTLSHESTVLLKEDHGNDIAPLMHTANGTFQTVIQFDVSCPR